MTTSATKLTRAVFSLTPVDNHRQANLCGPMDDNLKTIERRLGVEISYRGHEFTVVGQPSNSQAVVQVLKDLYIESQEVKGEGKIITPEMVHLAILEADCLEQEQPSDKVSSELGKQINSQLDNKFDDMLTIKTKRGVVKPRNGNQQAYVQSIITSDISFGVGVAGTGKTYLAVACAVDALERQEVRRILLTRPAVEAGEKLGFLPGDLSQKIDPYLRPLYDALFEMLGFEKVEKLIERNVIEIAPLAYMRGRTLNDAFIILDESQNTTVEQMKMFLTRIGFNSRAVITGDITQVDLPRHQMSGLRHAIEVLQDINGISFNFFQSKDVVRHPVVARVVDAYDSYEQKINRQKQEKKQAQQTSNDKSDVS
ncbi:MULTISPECIES: PhoH family protein [Colwellia]|uniref:PhoH-like protein n=1 Tax=Colwellia psychrerythraea (strain 34H / ATCC BAA-681) TaxID=167879 RepID=Q47Y79_COLP3|nr:MULTISPECIES: PhoH family protein [Colwellia]AAZ25673.1 phoH family protein [Colwellia psychrerythraea 34H]